MVQWRQVSWFSGGRLCGLVEAGRWFSGGRLGALVEAGQMV